MLPCVCSVIDHRWRQNVVRTSVTHWAAPRVPLFCSYHILTSSVIYYWTDARQHGIYLLNSCTATCQWQDMISFQQTSYLQFLLIQLCLGHSYVVICATIYWWESINCLCWRASVCQVKIIDRCRSTESKTESWNSKYTCKPRSVSTMLSYCTVTTASYFLLEFMCFALRHEIGRLTAVENNQNNTLTLNPSIYYHQNQCCGCQMISQRPNRK